MDLIQFNAQTMKKLLLAALLFPVICSVASAAPDPIPAWSPEPTHIAVKHRKHRAHHRRHHRQVKRWQRLERRRLRHHHV